MKYPRKFLELQIRFAQKIAGLKGITLEESLLKYTNLYKIFGIPDWSFDLTNDVWVEFLLGLRVCENIYEYIYEFYSQRYSTNNLESTSDPSFGCFSYHFDENSKTINIHFSNQDDPEPGALSKERIDLRLQELREMFTSIRGKYGDNIKVYGHSWLYNRESYRRLFPTEYLTQFSVDPNCFRGFGQWAQFLNSHGEVREDMEELFIKKVSELSSMSDIEDCFQYKVWHGRSEIKYFYELYKIDMGLSLR